MTWIIGLGREISSDKFFLKPDADAILNVPLRTGDGEDSSVGIYTVKSTYRVLMIQKKKERLAPGEGVVTGTSESDQHVWNAL